MAKELVTVEESGEVLRDLPPASAREKVEAMEDELMKLGLPQADIPLKHYFAPGLYAREMTIPAGVMLTGAVHKTEHLVTISAGRILVYQGEEGEGAMDLRAPATFVSKPGTKRVGIAIEDTVFTTYHATENTDIDSLVEELTESKADELMGGKNNKQLRYLALPENERREVLKW